MRCSETENRAKHSSCAKFRIRFLQEGRRVLIRNWKLSSSIGPGQASSKAAGIEKLSRVFSKSGWVMLASWRPGTR